MTYLAIKEFLVLYWVIFLDLSLSMFQNFYLPTNKLVRLSLEVNIRPGQEQTTELNCPEKRKRSFMTLTPEAKRYNTFTAVIYECF
jgi:hypothetical protein